MPNSRKGSRSLRQSGLSLRKPPRQPGAEELLGGPRKEPSAAEEAREAVKAELADLALPLDVLILGMGNDGHTASLFPDAPELAEAISVDCPDRVAAATPPSQSQQRITLTWPALKDARFTALHLKGQDKLETLEQALANPSDVVAMPVRAFLQSGLNVFWSP